MALADVMYLLPQIFQYLQIISYIVMILFFGSIAMRGWKGYLPWYLNLAARAAVGFLCLFVGVSIGPLITVLKTGILALFQLDLITVGMISAVLISVALYLISFKSYGALASLRKQAEKVQKKIRKMGHPPKHMTTEKWIGVAILVALTVLAAANFRGFPENPAQELMTNMGLPPMSPDCLSSMMAMTSDENIQNKLANPEFYINAEVKASLEQQSGETIFEMYRLDSGDLTIIAFKTTDDKTCFATETDFCICQ